MDLGLRGKSAVVAAASRGLGRAVAVELGAEGCRVALGARTAGALEDARRAVVAAGAPEAIAVPCDLSRPGEPERLVASAVAAFAGVDVLVTNAGGPPPGPFVAHDDATWQRAFEQNLLSVVRLVRAALPAFPPAGGRIVNLASLSVKEPIPGLLLSNSLRMAVAGLSKTLARELGPRGILVNTVLPGRIATDRLIELDSALAAASGRTAEQVRRDNEREIPLGRYGKPEEFAAMVVFLCSARASYVTGATFTIDGGASRSSL